MNIQESLTTLGFTDKEAAVYAVLLGAKKGTAMTVATAAGIKRPTAYFVLESLIEKKLVTSTKFRNVKDYRALPLEHLKSFVYQQKTQAEKSLPEMQKLYDARRFKVRLRIYNGPAAVKIFLEKSLRLNVPMHILGPKDRFANSLGSYWDFFLKRSQQLSVPPIFKHYRGDVSIMLWEGHVAFVSFGDDGQVFGFKNKELYTMYTHLFSSYEALA
jgi:hypothetical protein